MHITPGVRLATEFCYDCVHRNPRTGDKHTRYWCDAHDIMLDDLEGDDLVDDKPLQRNSIKLDECKLRNFEALIYAAKAQQETAKFGRDACRVLLLILGIETAYITCGTIGATATLLGMLLVVFAMALLTAWQEEL